MGNLIAFLFLLVFIINGIHCIILAWVLRHYLLKLGKEWLIIAGGRVSHIIELYKRAENSPNRKKYRFFVYYISIAYLVELISLVTFLVLMIFF